MDIEIITKHDSTRSEQWQHTLIIKIRGEQVELPIEVAKSLPNEINRALGNPANSKPANCAIFDVSTHTCDNCSYCLYEKSKVKHEQHTCLYGRDIFYITEPKKHTCRNWRE